MPWVRKEDTYPRHRKIRRLTDAQYRMHDEAIHWSAEHLTDGHVPADELDDVTVVKNPRRHVPTLIQRGLWHAAGHDCPRCLQPTDPKGWVIHDYLEYNPSRLEVMAERERKREAGRRGGLASAAVRRGKQAGSEPPEAEGKQSGSAPATASATALLPEAPEHPTRPDPTRTRSTSKTSSPPPSSVPREQNGGGGGNPDEHDPVLAAFVDDVLAVRPEWSRRSVLRALTDEDVAARPWHVIQHAMLAVARDPTSQQPGRLAYDGPWWRLPAQPRTAPAPPPVDLLAGGDHRPETRQRGLAAARAELAARTAGDP
jgi:hypothetical protein